MSEPTRSPAPKVEPQWLFREGQTLTAADLNRLLSELRELRAEVAALRAELDRRTAAPPRPQRVTGEFDVSEGRPVD